MNIKKATFSEIPSLVSYEGATVCICFDTEEKTVPVENNVGEGEAKETQTMYEAYAVRVEHPVTRPRIIDAIVTEAYPNDVMQAIINNHLIEAEGENPEHEAEFVEMQEWRNHAKEIAAQVMENI